MGIPDPIELMDGRIESQMDLIDSEDTYPCCICDERKPFSTTDWVCVSPMGDGPLACPECYFKEE